MGVLISVIEGVPTLLDVCVFSERGLFMGVTATQV